MFLKLALQALTEHAVTLEVRSAGTPAVHLPATDLDAAAADIVVKDIVVKDVKDVEGHQVDGESAAEMMTELAAADFDFLEKGEKVRVCNAQVA